MQGNTVFMHSLFVSLVVQRSMISQCINRFEKFVTQVASKVEISEGQSAHFEARLTPTEDPNMKVGFSLHNYEMLGKMAKY